VLKISHNWEEIEEEKFWRESVKMILSEIGIYKLLLYIKMTK
jgi:hypothetical protein